MDGQGRKKGRNGLSKKAAAAAAAEEVGARYTYVCDGVESIQNSRVWLFEQVDGQMDRVGQSRMQVEYAESDMYLPR